VRRRLRTLSVNAFGTIHTFALTHAGARVTTPRTCAESAGLQAKYLEVIGRSTGSDDRGYLIWKIREAEKGRINLGPRKTRARDGESDRAGGSPRLAP
jgi:hypothetical protein